MTSRIYDLILAISNAAAFTVGNNVIGNSTATTGMVVAVDYASNKLKIRLNNLQQEFSAVEQIHSNTIVTTGTANGYIYATELPFQANTMISNVTTAYATISSISPSTFIAEKNAFTQNPIVKLYSIYYPGEWYPPNANGNPTGDGAGYSWPSDFPLRLAEIVGDVTTDIQYNVSYAGATYTAYPVTVSGLDQSSDGKINELSLTLFNSDNIISALVEDPYLLGRANSNSVYATVNGELVYGIDPQTVDADTLDYTTLTAQTAIADARAKGLVYDANVVGYYGRANAAFDKTRADSTNSGWTRLKMDTRDLLGATVEIKTTFANFLDYWPEYSKTTQNYGNSYTVQNSLPYRVGDILTIGNTTASNATVISIASNNALTLSRPMLRQLYVGDTDSEPTGLYLRPIIGNQLLVIGDGKDNVHRYTMSTAFDITTAKLTASFYIGDRDTNPQGVAVSGNSLIMYIIGAQTDNIYQYTLSSGYNLTSPTYVSSFYVGDREIFPRGLVFNDSGNKFYVIGSNSDKIHQYATNTAWNIANSTYVSNVSVADNSPRDLFLKADGTQLYVLGTDTDRIYQYDLSEADNIASATLVANGYIGDYLSAASGIAIRRNGNTVYLSSSSAATVYQIPMSTAWDITTLGQGSTLPAGTPLYITNEQADSASYLQDVYKIDQLEGLTEYAATFGLVSWLQYFKIVTPKRKYYKNTCQWKYKGEECQYPGYGEIVIPGTNPVLRSNAFPIAANNMIMPLTGNIVLDNAADICAKSLAACSLRNNQQHYGGFPGVGRTVPQM
jgi:phage-related protein